MTLTFRSSCPCFLSAGLWLQHHSKLRQRGRQAQGFVLAREHSANRATPWSRQVYFFFLPLIHVSFHVFGRYAYHHIQRVATILLVYTALCVSRTLREHGIAIWRAQWSRSTQDALGRRTPDSSQKKQGRFWANEEAKGSFASGRTPRYILPLQYLPRRFHPFLPQFVVGAILKSCGCYRGARWVRQAGCEGTLRTGRTGRTGRTRRAGRTLQTGQRTTDHRPCPPKNLGSSILPQRFQVEHILSVSRLPHCVGRAELRIFLRKASWVLNASPLFTF